MFAGINEGKGLSLKLYIAFLVFISLLTMPLSTVALAKASPFSKVAEAVSGDILSLQDENGIRVVFNDVELYFNASNGGEITEYFDLSIDPSRSRNLVNLRWIPYYNLLPLFSSLFYKAPYPDSLFSTGGDASAKLWLISNTSEYVILQSSSRIMSRSGLVAKDVVGNTIYANSTWILRNSGLVSVERTFFVPTYVTIPSGWRWYPFYLTRTAGFSYDGTFYMFNTTYAYAYVVNETSYRNIFGLFPLMPSDVSYVFGVGMPFSNASLGGDGSHNIVIAYKYDELLWVNEWRSDNYYCERNNITEGGAVHEFGEAFNITTHTYHMLVNFTHQPIDETNVHDFAKYYADNPSTALLMELSVTSNKDVYIPEDYYAFYGSGVSYYNLTRLTGRLTVKNSSHRIIYQQEFGPANTTAGQAFNVTLLTGTVKSDAILGSYTVLFQIFFPYGIVIASSSRVITVTVP